MIIERYLFREVLRTCAAVFAVLALVYGADRFTRYLSDAAAGVVPPGLVVRILALKLAEEVPMLLSLALYLGVLVSLGRLYKDSEIIAFEAAGVGLGRLSLGVFRVVAVFSFAGAALSLFISPSLASMRGALLEEARNRAENQIFVPGRFKEFGVGDQVIYVEAVDDESGEMSNVFVRVRTPNRKYVLTSRIAHQVVRPASGARYMVLENGYRYAGLPWDAKFSVTRFERHAVRIDAQPKGSIAGRPKTLATIDLVDSGNPRHYAELQRRISTAVSIAVLGMLALTLARTSPREGRYAKLFVAIVVYFIYSNAINVFESLAGRGVVSGFVGVWSVHATMALVAFTLLVNQTSGGRRLSARLRSEGRHGSEGEWS